MGEVHLGGYTLRPLPERLEPGTPAIEAVIGWSAALRYLAELGMEEIRNHDHSLAAYAHTRLRALSGVHIAGPSDPDRLGAAVSFWVEGRAAEEVARRLSTDHNVLVRSGFHCAQPLHEVLGLPPTVRASFYLYNTREDVDRLAESLEAVLRIP
jgi:cysteine desulfurase/selenocysteine lyase